MTIIANNDHNVNQTVILTLTNTNCRITFDCIHSRITTVSLHRRIRTLNLSYLTLRYSIDDNSDVGNFFRHIRTRFRHVSILIGGTKVAHSNLLTAVPRHSVIRIVRAGLVNALLYYRRIIPNVLHRHDNYVIGVDSITTRGPNGNRDGCTTTGNNIRTLAHTLTIRLTPHGVHIGTITPNVIGARVDATLVNARRRRVRTQLLVGHCTRPRRVTRTILCVTSHNLCLANRILPIGNKLGVP